jgi:hypothetical protein
MLQVPCGGHSAGSLPGTWHCWVVWKLQKPTTLVQSPLAVHFKPAGLLHWPGVGVQFGSVADEHEVAGGYAQEPGVLAQAGPGLQAARLVLHRPGDGEQAAAEVQDVAGGFKHWPMIAGQSVFTLQAAPPTVQWPLLGVPVQSPAEVQDWPTGVTQTPGVPLHWAAVVQD